MIMDINEDIFYNILLRSDINIIKSLSVITTIINKICHNYNFWYNKFLRDNMLIITKRNTIFAWIEEYKKVTYSIKSAEDLLNIFLVTIKAPKLNQYYIGNILDSPDMSLGYQGLYKIENRRLLAIALVDKIKFNVDDIDELNVGLKYDGNNYNIKIVSRIKETYDIYEKITDLKNIIIIFQKILYYLPDIHAWNYNGTMLRRK